MIIPIGHGGDVRRIPYITLILVALNIVVFMFTMPKANRDNIEITERYFDYFSVVAEWMMDSSGESVFDIYNNPEEFEAQLENPRISEDSPYYDRVMSAKREYDEALNRHVFFNLGVSRKNVNIIRLLTAMFTHADIFHLIGNMWFLLLLGANIEDTYGRMNFLVFYIISGFVSSGIFLMTQASDTLPLIGASGAIAGLMGVFMVRRFKTKIKFFYFFFPVRPLFGTFRLIAGIVLPLWFVQQVLEANADAGSGVAFMAHIGGFLFGLAVAVLISYFKIEERFIAPKIDEQANLLGLNAEESSGIDKYAGGSYSEAAALLLPHFGERMKHDTFIPLYDSLLKTGDRQSSGRVAELYIGHIVGENNTAYIKDLFFDLNDRKMLQGLTSNAKFMLGKYLCGINMIEQSIMLIRDVIEDEKNTILGSKALLFAVQRDLMFSGFKELLEEYAQGAGPDTEMIIDEAKRRFNDGEK